MSLYILPNELVYLILAELKPDDLLSCLEAHPGLGQFSIYCIRRCHNLDLRPYCISGNIFAVRLLLQGGAHADAWSYNSGSPLSDAAANGHEEIARLLLEHGARMDHDIENDLRPLQVAAMKGYVTIVRLMLNHGVDVDSRSPYKYTALHTAVRHRGHYLFVKDWLWRCRCVHLPTNNHTVVDYYATIKLLLDSGADVNARTQYTPLHEAITSYPYLQRDTVSLLIGYGADVNAQSHGGGLTPLHLIDPQARRYDPRHTDIARLLLAHGADVNVADLTGKTPLHLAASESVSDSQRDSLTRVYLAHGAYANPTTVWARETPLHVALDKEFWEINIFTVKMLVKAGADVNARFWGRNTPAFALGCSWQIPARGGRTTVGIRR